VVERVVLNRHRERHGEAFDACREASPVPARAQALTAGKRVSRFG
jgi:hypothetical protein